MPDRETASSSRIALRHLERHAGAAKEYQVTIPRDGIILDLMIVEPTDAPDTESMTGDDLDPSDPRYRVLEKDAKKAMKTVVNLLNGADWKEIRPLQQYVDKGKDVARAVIFANRRGGHGHGAKSQYLAALLDAEVAKMGYRGGLARRASKAAGFPEQKIVADAYKGFQQRSIEILRALKAAGLDDASCTIMAQVANTEGGKKVLDYAAGSVDVIFPDVDWTDESPQEYEQEFKDAMAKLGYRPSGWDEKFPGSYTYEFKIK